MGILGDIINKKINNIINNKIEEKQSDLTKEEPTRYNRLWLDKIVREAGYALTDNENKINNILKALNKRDGHCPCGGMTDEFICPCNMMRTYGTCKCGLYRDLKDIDPKGQSTAKIKK
jgi:ferredoxin-thioredoxin reductase catalytic subunit